MGIMRITHISAVQRASTRLKTGALGGGKTQKTRGETVRRQTYSFAVLIISSLKVF